MAEKTKGNKPAERKASSPAKAAKPAAARSKVGEPRKSAAAGRAKTRFNLEAPQAQEVCIAGSFNGWEPMPLRRNSAGVWSKALILEPGEYEYRFVVDGVWWDDAANMMRRMNVFGTENCVVFVE